MIICFARLAAVTKIDIMTASALPQAGCGRAETTFWPYLISDQGCSDAVVSTNGNGLSKVPKYGQQTGKIGRISPVTGVQFGTHPNHYWHYQIGETVDVPSQGAGLCALSTSPLYEISPAMLQAGAADMSGYDKFRARSISFPGKIQYCKGKKHGCRGNQNKNADQV